MQAIKELRILSGLDRRLDGRCSNYADTCPTVIEEDIYENEFVSEWRCEHCIEMFYPICDLEDEELFPSTVCPCVCLEGEVVLARLEERIEELVDMMLKGVC